ncbi:MAG: glycosyltransferase [Oscillospiraceae bacterium]
MGKNIFKNCDKIIVMKSSEEHHQKNNELILDKISVLDIPLLSCNRVVEKKRNNRNYKLVFIGSINKTIRNPKFIISLLESISMFNIEVSFIGEINCIDMFDRLKEKYQSRISFLGRVSHDISIEQMLNADILLNIGNSNSSMVPSKIFEYMSTGKPIISTLPIKNEPSAQYLTKYPSALIFDEDRSDFNIIAEEILNFIGKSKDIQVNYDDLEKKFYKNTPKAFVDLINDLKK